MTRDDLVAREALARGYVDEARLADARRRQAAMRQLGLPSDLLGALAAALSPDQLAALRAASAAPAGRDAARTIAGAAPVAAAAPLAALRRPEPARPGERIGPYTLEGELGRGAMGAVYRARHATLGRTVALKLCLSPSHQARQRFLREGQAAGALSHPNIVAVHDAGDAGGRPWLAMDLVEGSASLAQRLVDGGPLAPPEAAAIGAVLARALAYAHERGVLHRDIKPANILLGPDGAPLLVDFGLAKVVEGAESLTRTGELLGTPAYMAPEQASGRDVDARADIWSLGATLYESLAGRSPFADESLLGTIARVLAARYEPLTAARPDAPPALEAIVARCLERRPSDRYPDAAALAVDLERFASGGGSSALARRRRRRALAALLGAGAVALGVGLAVALAHGALDAPAPSAPRAAPSVVSAPPPPPTDPAAAEREAARLVDIVEPRARAQAARAWLARNPGHARAGEVAALLSAARLEFPAATVAGVSQGALVDTRRALLLETDGLVLWDLERGAALRRWPVGTALQPVPAPDGRWVLIDGEGRLAWLDLDGDVGPWVGAGGLTRVDGLASSRAGLVAVAGFAGSAGSVQLLDATGRVVRTLVRGETAEDLDVAFSADGDALAVVAGSARVVGTQGGPARDAAVLFDVGSGEERWRVPLDTRGDVVAFAPDGRRLAVGTAVGQLLLLDRESGELVGQLVSDASSGGLLRVAVPAPLRGLTFSPAGGQLCSTFGDEAGGGFVVWDLQTGGAVRWVRRPRLVAHSLSPDGQALLVELFEGGVEVWWVR